MGTYPWGPHGPSVPANTVTPNPTPAYQPPAPVSQPAPNYYPTYSGGGGAAINPNYSGSPQGTGAVRPGGHFFLNSAFVAFFWPVWVLLYPVSAFAGFVSFNLGAYYSQAYFRSGVWANPYLPALGVGVLAGLVVLWNVSRLEHLFSRWIVYRLPRHVLRLALVTAFTALILEFVPTLQRGLQPALSVSAIAPATLLRVLMNPRNLGTVLGVAVAAHFLLWNFTWARNFWHRRLMGAQLRKRGT